MHNDSPAIELFAIGTELAIGQIQDTNSFWIAQQIARLGGRPRRLTILNDDLDDIVSALRESLARGTRILLLTGGLGPTPDDLTVEAVCRLLSVPASVHEPTLEDYVRRRNYKDRSEISPGLKKMGTIPAGAEAFPNPAGWAPLIKLQHRDATFLIMAGPPKEMKAVFSTYILEFLGSRFKTKSVTRRIWTEMFESEVSPHLQRVMQESPGTYLKAYVALRSEQRNAMPVDIVAQGQDVPQATANLDVATRMLGDLIRAAGKRFEIEETPAASS
ncbi:MAG: competence/damage-inducible protein A [Planctomycetes bacterium]|nr:competence/damage-inducible protein A [Planctomycetota bacterium]